jgi:hypothetical protein
MFEIKDFIRAVVSQDALRLPGFFAPGARIAWHNSGELFTVRRYIRANCEYPDVGAGSPSAWTKR